MGKNVAVFVDVANIFYAAKAAGVDIDYVTLLKAAVSGRDFVRAYAYTGLDPENENQRNFHSFLSRHGYRVVSKDIRKYGDGKVKANLDIELVVDMMKTARNLDVAIVVSGDGDFAPAIRAVQEMGVRVEVISFRGNTSSDLIDVADIFTDITQIARVDRDSQRSGRRVADDEEDLSMTEVPEKQTEGAPRRRRGRGGRGERTEKAPVTHAAASRNGGRPEAAAGSGRMVVLPGEKLSRVAPGEAPAEPIEEVAADSLEIEVFHDEEPGAEGAQDGGAEGDAGAHRRRRRGGRGRGRGGRGREETRTETGLPAGLPEDVDELEEAEGQPLPLLSQPASHPNPFGSVWDSQIGMAGQPTELAPLPADEEDFAEPEIPEYLLAERRRGRGGRGGNRGGGVRSAYAAAIGRERFGRTRYPEPARQPQPQRRQQPQQQPRPQRQPQPPRQAQPQRGGGRSAEPWSEVPPELEELLRQQLAAKATQPVPAGATRTGEENVPAEEIVEETAAEIVAEAPARGRGRGRGRAAAAAAPDAGAQAPALAEATTAPAAEAPRRGGRRRAGAAAGSVTPAPEGVQVPAEEAAATPEASPARRRRTAKAATEAAGSAEAPAAGGAETPSEASSATAAPRARRGRAKAADTAAAAPEPSESGAAAGEAPKRRAPARRKTAAAAEGGDQA